MYDAAHDIAILKSILYDFVPFIQSDIVFWQLSKPGPFLNRYPKLTVAGILFCVRKLTMVECETEHKIQDEKNRLVERLCDHLSRWHANVERKALIETLGRLRSWEIYIDECLEDASDCSQHYLEEVYGRVYIQLLLEIMGDTKEINDIRNRINKCDNNLYRMFTSGQFIWDKDLQVAFPPKEQWYLYGRPRITC